MFKKTFIYLNDLVSKSIFYIKAKKFHPEASNPQLVDANPNVVNLLKCLGFSVQRASVIKIRDQKDPYVIVFPDERFLDLNLRMTHVLSSLIEMCFDKVSYKNADGSNDYEDLDQEEEQEELEKGKDRERMNASTVIKFTFLAQLLGFFFLLFFMI